MSQLARMRGDHGDARIVDVILPRDQRSHSPRYFRSQPSLIVAAQFPSSHQFPQTMFSNLTWQGASRRIPADGRQAGLLRAAGRVLRVTPPPAARRQLVHLGFLGARASRLLHLEAVESVDAARAIPYALTHARAVAAIHAPRLSLDPRLSRRGRGRGHGLSFGRPLTGTGEGRVQRRDGQSHVQLDGQVHAGKSRRGRPRVQVQRWEHVQADRHRAGTGRAAYAPATAWAVGREHTCGPRLRLSGASEWGRVQCLCE